MSEFREDTNWCDVCYSRGPKPGIRLLIIDDQGAHICTECIDKMAQQLGLIDAAIQAGIEEALEALR